ncbi:MAG: cytochrome B6 [Microcystaceae cyanobacterium]|nr:cytochrome B6 [Merismopediaceae bacterium]
MPVAGVAVFIAYILGLTGLTLGLLYGLRAVKLI